MLAKGESKKNKSSLFGISVLVKALFVVFSAGLVSRKSQAGV
jgi:hypothetical protein